MATIVGKHNGPNDITLSDWEYGVKAYPGDVALIDGRVWCVYDDGRCGHVRGWDVTEQLGTKLLDAALLEERDLQNTYDSLSRENA